MAGDILQPEGDDAARVSWNLRKTIAKYQETFSVLERVRAAAPGEKTADVWWRLWKLNMAVLCSHSVRSPSWWRFTEPASEEVRLLHLTVCVGGCVPCRKAHCGSGSRLQVLIWSQPVTFACAPRTPGSRWRYDHLVLSVNPISFFFWRRLLSVVCECFLPLCLELLIKQ